MDLWLALAGLLLVGCGTVPEPTVLVEAACEPVGIGVDAQNIYWSARCGSGSIRSALKSSGLVTELVPNEPHAFALAMDADNLYWEVVASLDPNALDGEIVKVAKTGGTPVVLASSQKHPLGMPGTLLVDNINVYWASGTDDSVMTVAKDGSGSPVQVVTASCPPWLGIDSQYIYWSDCTALFRRDTIALTTEKLLDVSPVETAISDFVVTTSDVYYWATQPSGEGGISLSSLYKLDKSSRAVTLLEERHQDVMAPPMSSDMNGVYWREQNLLMSARLRTNEIQTLVRVDPLTSLSDIAADDQHVYWTDNSQSRIYVGPN